MFNKIYEFFEWLVVDVFGFNEMWSNTLIMPLSVLVPVVLLILTLQIVYIIVKLILKKILKTSSSKKVRKNKG